jgi:dipeptidyl aminopeptidase/acylaminoacyl peptidase
MNREMDAVKRVTLCGAWPILLCVLAAVASSQQRTDAKAGFVEKEISFKAQDGWTIYGTLSIPSGLGRGEKVPGILMVHSPSHDRDIYLGAHQVGLTTYAKENLTTATGGMVTLRIDIRGRGKSAEGQEYHSFTEEQRARVALDVGGAIKFLSEQEQVDGNRIGVVAEGASAEPAVSAGFGDHRVAAMALLSGRVGSEVREMVGTRDIPVLCVASKEDRVGVADMAAVYRLSPSSASDLLVYSDLGIGYPMFIVWANKFPNEKPLESTVGEWLAARLRSAGREVSFKTADGWTLYGTLRGPAGSGEQGVPGVVLLHSYLTDRHVFDHLEQLLSDGGFAVLNFDFRGRGESKGKGGYFDLSLEERDQAYLDAKAALDLLASQKGVNSDRLALVATSIGVKYGMKAAAPDSRVKAFVMLGGMPDRPDVENSRFPILFVSSKGSPPIMKAFQDFYRRARDRGSSLLEYEGGSIGYQVFELDHSLEPLIVRWLKPQLSMP